MFLAHKLTTGRAEAFRGFKQRKPMATPEGIKDFDYGSALSLSTSISSVLIQEN